VSAAAAAERVRRQPLALLPGLALCIVVGIAAQLLGQLEALLFGRAWIEPLVLAILLGMLIANAGTLPPSVRPGVRFGAKTVLDIAVALLGATLSLAALRTLGVAAVLLIAAMVFVALLAGFWIGRLLGLNRRLAMLIAAGNAICGNSAIAAVAPIINADEEEIAAAISLTALLGVVTVLLLPVAVYAFALPLERYALLTGLTVYAVPQVIAAAAPFGAATTTLATFVKLARVLMLGPLTLLLSLFARRFAEPGGGGTTAAARPRLFLPWFIIAFLALAACRWTGLIGENLAQPLGLASNWMAVVAMAALGFGVRLRSLIDVGPRVAVATVLVNVMMVALAFGMLALL